MAWLDNFQNGLVSSLVYSGRYNSRKKGNVMNFLGIQSCSLGCHDALLTIVMWLNLSMAMVHMRVVRYTWYCVMTPVMHGMNDYDVVCDGSKMMFVPNTMMVCAMMHEYGLGTIGKARFEHTVCGDILE
eukprot:15364979-Ditylum_brightwellii.AAC.1